MRKFKDMKKILGILLVLMLISCKEKQTTLWEIERLDGTKDTIEAQNYWIYKHPDLIMFEIDDTTKIIYSTGGIVSFRKL